MERSMMNDDLMDADPVALKRMVVSMRQRQQENEDLIDRLNLLVQALIDTFRDNGHWDEDHFRRSLKSLDILDGSFDGRLGIDRTDVHHD